MKPIVIIKVGDTFADLAQSAGDFEHWIEKGLGKLKSPVTVIDPRINTLPAPGGIAGAIVTGSHAMVTDRADWSETLAAWLRKAVEEEIPLLGICYGHQLLAHALGGKVDYHPQGMEIGSVHISKTAAASDDPLFHDLPASFMAHVVHSQSVRTLPPEAVLLAENAFEHHHAYRIGRHAWGVQFHPEFDHRAMGSYITKLSDHLKEKGADVPTLQSQLAYTHAASGILNKFGKLAENHPPYSST